MSRHSIDRSASWHDQPEEPNTAPQAPEPRTPGRVEHALGGMAFGLLAGLVALLILVWHDASISGADRLILACVPAAAGFLSGLTWPSISCRAGRPVADMPTLTGATLASTARPRSQTHARWGQNRR